MELCVFVFGKRNARTVVGFVARNLGWILQVNGLIHTFYSPPSEGWYGRAPNRVLRSRTKVRVKKSCSPAQPSLRAKSVKHRSPHRDGSGRKPGPWGCLQYCIHDGHGESFGMQFVKCWTEPPLVRDRCIGLDWRETPAFAFWNPNTQVWQRYGTCCLAYVVSSQQVPVGQQEARRGEPCRSPALRPEQPRLASCPGPVAAAAAGPPMFCTNWMDTTLAGWLVGRSSHSHGWLRTRDPTRCRRRADVWESKLGASARTYGVRRPAGRTNAAAAGAGAGAVVLVQASKAATRSLIGAARIAWASAPGQQTPPRAAPSGADQIRAGAPHHGPFVPSLPWRTHTPKKKKRGREGGREKDKLRFWSHPHPPHPAPAPAPPLYPAGPGPWRAVAHPTPITHTPGLQWPPAAAAAAAMGFIWQPWGSGSPPAQECTTFASSGIRGYQRIRRVHWSGSRAAYSSSYHCVLLFYSAELGLV